jgi:hypothetical protein
VIVRSERGHADYGNACSSRKAAARPYASTRARTTPMMTTLCAECTMIPIHALWNPREGVEYEIRTRLA